MFDAIDLKILRELQRDADRPVSAIADAVGLSTNPCWRRIKRLEEAGVVKARVALVDPEAVNLGLTGFVLIKTAQHNADWLSRFATGIPAIPEVLEFHRITGAADYLLKVVAPDIAGYDRIYKKIIATAEVADVAASFSMEPIKVTTELPLDHAPRSKG